MANHEMVAKEQFPETADIETSSEDYARRFSGRVGKWFLKVQEQATLKMLAPYPGATVLDVGGGHGQITAALVENDYRPTVLGSSEACKTRIQGCLDRGQCVFKVGDILDLPYPDRSFDVVVSYRLLPHVTQWERYLGELARVARQAVILDYPEVRSVNSLAFNRAPSPHGAPASYLFRFKKRLEGNTRPYTCFREEQVLSAFRRHGFERADRYAEFFLPMVLHRKMKQPALSAGLEMIFRLCGLTGLFGSPVILRLIRREA